MDIDEYKKEKAAIEKDVEVLLATKIDGLQKKYGVTVQSIDLGSDFSTDLSGRRMLAFLRLEIRTDL